MITACSAVSSTIFVQRGFRILTVKLPVCNLLQTPVTSFPLGTHVFLATSKQQMPVLQEVHLEVTVH